MRLRWNQVAALALLIVALWPLFQPGPEPDPTPGPMQIAVVCETAMQTKLPQGQLAIMNSLSFREKLTAKGHTFANIDPNTIAGKDNQPPAEWKWALDIAPPLPALCVRKGDKAKRLDLPADPEAAMAVITKEGG